MNTYIIIGIIVLVLVAGIYFYSKSKRAVTYTGYTPVQYQQINTANTGGPGNWVNSLIGTTLGGATNLIG